jgi:hypothetical protein
LLAGTTEVAALDGSSQANEAIVLHLRPTFSFQFGCGPQFPI